MWAVRCPIEHANVSPYRRMDVVDDLLEHNRAFAAGVEPGHLDIHPARRLAVVTCMDSRLDAFAALGLRQGEAHVLRNAGGVITDDVIRSLAISQRCLGTQEIMLIHHTDCGMLTFNDQEFAEKLEGETGQRPQWEARSFADLDQDVRDSIQRIKDSSFIPRTDSVRGFVYDVKTGGLREVS
jgi:carbonic anhydrase